MPPRAATPAPIERGQPADLVVLDKDYFTVSDSAMHTIRPVLTFDSSVLTRADGTCRVREVSRFA